MSENERVQQLISKLECLEIIKTVTSDNKMKLNHFEYEIVPVSSEIMGYLGEYYNLRITVKKNKNAKGKLFQLFVKALPVTNDLNRKLVEELEIFPKEVTFYTDLFKEMEKYTPANWHCKCYFTRSDILVFENLTLFEFRNMTDNEKFNDLHVQTTLKCLAQMHCSSIVLEEKSGYSIGEKYKSSLYEITLNDKTGWLPAGLKAIEAVASKIPKYQNENIKNLVPDPYSFDFLHEISNPSTKYRNTFCHRDIWNRNLLFRYDETESSPREAILVDFQNCRYCVPAVDVMMTLILNQSASDRKKNFDWCTKFYYENLKNDLKTYDISIDAIITFDEFLETCKMVQLLPLILKGIYVPFTNAPDKYYFSNLEKSDPKKYDNYLKNDRTECVLKFVEEDANFREIMFDTIEDIIENFVEYKKLNNIID